MPVTASSRELVRRFLAGSSTDRLPIVMHLGAYAARLQQLSYQQVSQDPTLLANALQSAQKLFACDGLIIMTDPTVEAAACGCTVAWRDDEPVVTSHPWTGTEAIAVSVDGIENHGRLAVTLEATRRLTAIIGKDVALFPAVTGPVTLAQLMCGLEFENDLDLAPDRAYEAIEAASKVTMHVAKQYLEIGTDYLVVFDPLLGTLDPAHYPRLTAALRPLWNVVDFYDARALLQTRVEDGDRVAGLLAIGAGGLFAEGSLTEGDGAGRVAGDDQCVAVGLPSSIFTQDAGDLQQTVSAWRDGGRPAGTLLACSGIPRVAPPENVHEVLRLLRA